ncbi:DNA polymerase III subunit alpha [Planctomycetota bacterium]
MSATITASSSAVPVLRSNFSFLTGAFAIDEALMQRLRERGYDYAILADRNGLYGAVPFYKLCREHGIRPILGVSLEWAGEGRPHKRILIAKNYRGYQNLCRLITRRQLAGNEEDFDLDAELTDCAEGVIDLHAAGAPVHEVFFLEEKDFSLHHSLVAIRECGLRQQVKENLLAPGGVLPHAGRMSPQWRQIIGDCNLELPLGKPIFPKCPLPDGMHPQAWLLRQCLEGIRRRYDRNREKARQRLRWELDIISKLGFTDYFIITGDIMRFARERGIPACGRGSAASSIVAYSLGITNVCPLKYDLLFERFLHIERKDLPDVDIDFCWRRRDEVINYAYDTYGHDKVAMISTHNTFQPRSGFRETAKAFGISNDEVNRMSRLLGRGAGVREAVCPPHTAEIIPYDQEPFTTIIDQAERIMGFPNHLSVHPGGIVIADIPIDHYVPLEKAAKGVTVTQYEMRAIKDIGLVKIDLLGNRALSECHETVELIRQHGGAAPDLQRLPADDPKTAALVRGGNTIGCFQIESPGMRNLLKMLKTSSEWETILAHSLIRPGAADGGMKERYADIVNGKKKVPVVHPRLRDVLKANNGIAIFDEDVTRLIHAITALPMHRCEVLRKALSKNLPEDARIFGSPEQFKKLLDSGSAAEPSVCVQFMQAARNNGFSYSDAKTLWRYLNKFSVYMFCKAHGAGYGVIAWQTAYLKAHYPAQFAVALGNNHAGMYPHRALVSDMQRNGVTYLPPSVNAADIGYHLEAGKVRIGLGGIKGLTRRVMSRLIEQRPFHSLADLLSRVRLAYEEARSLILCGAMDCLGDSRPAMIFELKMRHRSMKDKPGASGSGKELLLFKAGAAAIDMPDLPDFEPLTKLKYELDILDIAVTCHPMTAVKSRLNGLRFVDCRKVKLMAGKHITITGVAIARRSTGTSNGRRMGFITLEDETGLVECVLFPRVYEKCRANLGFFGPYQAAGRVQDDNGAITLNLDSLELL